MKHIVKRTVALALMLGVTLGTTFAVASTSKIDYKEPSADSGDVVLVVNGSEVRSQEYASYMLYNMKYYENQYAQYGITNLWDDESTASMMGSSMPDAAVQQAEYMRIILAKFKEEGLSLTEEQEQEIRNTRKEMIESLGSEKQYQELLAGYGFDEDGYNNFVYVGKCFESLNDLYFGENGTMVATDDEIMNYFKENYIGAKHILILTADPSTGAVTRTDEEAQKEAQAILDQLKAGADFDTLMNEKSEDTGLQSYPNGYIFTEGEMVTEFYDTAKALKEGEVSGLVKTDYGYHIIERVPIDYEAELANYKDTIEAALGKTMDSLLQSWMDEATVETTDLFNTITYQNVWDYAPVEKPAATDNTASASSAATSTEPPASSAATSAESPASSAATSAESPASSAATSAESPASSAATSAESPASSAATSAESPAAAG